MIATASQQTPSVTHTTETQLNIKYTQIAGNTSAKHGTGGVENSIASKSDPEPRQPAQVCHIPCTVLMIVPAALSGQSGSALARALLPCLAQSSPRLASPISLPPSGGNGSHTGACAPSAPCSCIRTTVQHAVHTAPPRAWQRSGRAKHLLERLAQDAQRGVDIGLAHAQRRQEAHRLARACAKTQRAGSSTHHMCKRHD